MSQTFLRYINLFFHKVTDPGERYIQLSIFNCDKTYICTQL